MTLKHLLESAHFPKLVLINKGAGLEREIESADISETPDVSHYLKKNSLLFTTGMAFQNDPAGFCRMIRELAALPAAGIAVKLGRFLGQLHPTVLETADELGFPVFQVPTETTLGIMCHQTLSFLWNSEAQQLGYALKTQQAFSKMLIQNAPLDEMVGKLATLLKQEVILLDPFLEIVVSCDPQGAQSVSGYAIAAQQAIRGDPRFQQEDCKKTTVPLPPGHSGPANAAVFPIKFNSYNPALLVVPSQQEMPYPFTHLVIEQVVAILAFSMYKNQMARELAWKPKEGFIRKISKAHQNRSEVEGVVSAYGEEYGIKKSNYYRIVYAGIDGFAGYPEEKKADAYQIAYEYLERLVPGAVPYSCLFPYPGGYYCILLQKPTNGIAKLLGQAALQLEDLFSIRLSFAVGTVVDQISGVWYSMAKAQQAYSTMEMQNKAGFFAMSKSTDISDLTRFIPQEHAKQFAVFLLRGLAFPSGPAELELRNTLESYLSNQGDLTKTAKDIFVHRNTVTYRIARINALLGLDVDDPEQSLQLRMALRLSSNESYP